MIENDEIFITSMKIGALFNRLDSKITSNWHGSEECSEFTRRVIEYMEENKTDICSAMDIIFSAMAKGNILKENHMWDCYCKGFLAGEILGEPTEENIMKVSKAEKLWNDTDEYGYYQEVLNAVK